MVWKRIRGKRKGSHQQKETPAGHIEEEGCYSSCSSRSTGSRDSNDMSADDVGSERSSTTPTSSLASIGSSHPSTRTSSSSSSLITPNRSSVADNESIRTMSTNRSSSSSLSSGPEGSKLRKNKKKSVKFHEIHIRDYERTISDNPSCSSGPPIG